MKKNNNSETYSTLRNKSKFPKIVHLGLSFCNITFLSFNKKADVNPVKVCLLTLSLSGFSKRFRKPKVISIASYPLSQALLVLIGERILFTTECN